ncbi:YkvA family protein [Flexivirga endophytica]|nr:YkvA family protein [Flexivirga endophytica]
MRRISDALQDVSEPGGPSIAVRVGCLPRMTKAVARGEYNGVSAGHLALIAAAAAYVVSPVDLLPEALVGVIGLADDAVVLAWLARTLTQDTDQFLEWERRRGDTIQGERLS